VQEALEPVAREVSDEIVVARPPLAPTEPPPSARARDERLRAMLDQNYDFIWRSLRRFGVPESRVDDAAQQVFLVASQKLELITLGAERSFLFGTAMRVASDVRRSAVVRREVPTDLGEEERCEAPLPDELLDQRRARAMLDQVLDEMEDDLRAVFVMFELEGLSTQEIAELVGIPTGTAASRLRRAREEFQAKVKRLAVARGRRAP
jgi:RNA polymerase sigma-70 factor (ECF subfamily)